jgi:hypothetical protein
MPKGMLLLAACVSLLLRGAIDPAQAAPVTFVSGNGNNSNDCLTPATACREFGNNLGGGAISKTDSGGTIHVLPGVYQPFEIFGWRNILADQG